MVIGFDHVGLSVADLDAAEAFYCGAFDFSRQLVFELTPHPIRGVMLMHENGMRLELFQHQASAPALQATTPIEAIARRGYGHFALKAPDIEPLFEAAIAAGAEVKVPPSASPEPGIRFAFVSDPEGNLVELVERG